MKCTRSPVARMRVLGWTVGGLLNDRGGLLPLNRENEKLANYPTNELSSRKLVLMELKELLEINPKLKDKLVFPDIPATRLRSIAANR